MLTKVKLALRIVGNDFDSELNRLIAAAIKDLEAAGVNATEVTTDDDLLATAVITYCKMMFGEPDQYDRLKASYDEQKAQMSTRTGYTTWEAE